MKVLFHNVYDGLNQNNNLFKNDNALIGDNLLSPFLQIDRIGSKMGWTIGTYSKVPVEDADAIVFIDYPRKNDPIFKYALANNVKAYLITLESPIIRPEVFQIELHKPFERIFTWSDKLLNCADSKYIKINYSFNITADFSNDIRENAIVIIAGNKKSTGIGELYSERLKCIKWFNENAPESLDLFGFNWDLKAFCTEDIVGFTLNKLNQRFRIFKQNFSSYKGTILRKYDTLPKYKFCICFENVFGYDGYITEKIFDCFFSGTIPIYKGAPNVSTYIPEGCYINYDDFSDISELYAFTKSLNNEDIRAYQKNIKEFLLSDHVYQFTTEVFAETIISALSEYNNETHYRDTSI